MLLYAAQIICIGRMRHEDFRADRSGSVAVPAEGPERTGVNLKHRKAGTQHALAARSRPPGVDGAEGYATDREDGRRQAGGLPPTTNRV